MNNFEKTFYEYGDVLPAGELPSVEAYSTSSSAHGFNDIDYAAMHSFPEGVSENRDFYQQDNPYQEQHQYKAWPSHSISSPYKEDPNLVEHRRPMGSFVTQNGSFEQKYMTQNNYVIQNNHATYVQPAVVSTLDQQHMEPSTEVLQQDTRSFFHKADQFFVSMMGKYALRFIQASLGLIFLWFGALKLFPGMSPAENLVKETSYELFSLVGLNISPTPVLILLAIWEVLIGFGLLLDLFKKPVIIMIILHMPSTALPLILLPETVWTQFPLGLTLEGQYIIKNLIIIGGAMAVGASTRESKM